MTTLGRSGACGVAIAKFLGFRFSAVGGSGFGCQGTEVLSLDSSYETSNY